MHLFHALGRRQPKVSGQQVKVDAELSRGFDPAAWFRMTKTFDTELQPVHSFIIVPERLIRRRLRLVNRVPAHYRSHNLQILDLVHIHREQIVRQNYEVRQLTRCNGSFDRLFA